MTATHSDDLDLLERLGGSGATVNRAVVRATGRVVVVKRVGWDRPDVADRLGREASVLRRIQHPSLVRLLDVVEDDSGRSLVLVHAPGGSLASRLRLLGPMDPAEVADLGGRLARALAALHGGGVIHRDVHPGNVLVDAELQPVLADLDNALDTRGTALPGDAEVVGSAAHVDPLLFTGTPPGVASDLHALASTLWTAATGTPPPRTDPTSPIDLPPDTRVPDPLRALLRTCLDGTAGDAATVAGRLEAAAIDLQHLPPPPAGAAPTPPVESDPPAPPTPAPPRPVGGCPVQQRPVLLAGGSGGAGDPVTRRWGTAPRPQPASAAVARRGGGMVLAGLVLLLPLAVIGWFAAQGGGQTATTDAAASVAVPPAPCTSEELPHGAAQGATAEDGARALADLDGDGCSEVVRLVGGELHTPDGRYRLGQPGDVLLTGDWDGDARWGVGLYRPATGAVYLFDAPGAGARSRPAEQHPRDGTPRVVETSAGTHRVEVAVEP